MSPHKPTIMLGAGGHALVLLDLMQQMEIELIAVVSPSVPQIDELKQYQWINGDENVTDFKNTEFYLINGIGSTGKIDARASVFNYHSEHEYNFISLSHPTASISKLNVKLGKGFLALANSLIGPSVSIGYNVLINSGVIIEHETTIGDHSHVASGSVICGNCVLGKRVHIGAGSTINQNINIGDGAVIASGSVVIHDVEPYTLVAGIPAIVK